MFSVESDLLRIYYLLRLHVLLLRNFTYGKYLEYLVINYKPKIIYVL